MKLNFERIAVITAFVILVILIVMRIRRAGYQIEADIDAIGPSVGPSAGPSAGPSVEPSVEPDQQVEPYEDILGIMRAAVQAMELREIAN